MEPVSLNLGFISIRLYSILLSIAFITGGFLALREFKKNNIDENKIIDLFFYLIIFTLLGARIYYVLFEFEYYSTHLIDIFKVWEGGLAIHGGLIAGILTVIIYCRKNKINIPKTFDILVVSIILGQAIGRWGNFFNREAFGPITSLSYLKSIHLPSFIIDGMYIDGFYRQPTFFYESLWCFIGFIILLIIRKNKNLKIGQLSSFYLVWYGLERAYVEGLRTDSLMLGSIKVAQVVSILMIIIGIIWFIYTIIKPSKYKE